MNITEWTGSGEALAGIMIILLLAAMEMVWLRWRAGSAEYALQRRSKILSSSEKNFFECLINALGDEFYVFAKVSILDVVEPSPRAGFIDKRAYEKACLESVCIIYCVKKAIFQSLAWSSWSALTDQMTNVYEWRESNWSTPYAKARICACSILTFDKIIAELIYVG